jgi:hypothetical protein
LWSIALNRGGSVLMVVLVRAMVQRCARRPVPQNLIGAAVTGFHATAAAVAVLLNTGVAATAQSASTVTVGGVPAALLQPEGRPRGSVILMTGGDGRVGVGPGGSVSVTGNQLVRTRQAYAAQGYVVLVPVGSVDVPRAVTYMAQFARPVALVGTSRGTQRAARGIAQGARPDVLVLTSGFLSPDSGEGVHIHVMGRVRFPSRLPRTLVVHHRRDACRHTLPEGVAPFLAWAREKAEVAWLDGGTSRGDPCGPRSYHGFNGLDAEVVAVVTRFIGGP